MKKRKWIWRGVTAGICVVIVVVTAVVVVSFLRGDTGPAVALKLDRFTKAQQLRIEGALDEIIAFNPTDEEVGEVYEGAEMREDSYEEGMTEGVHQAIFIMDLPAIQQSYRVSYYYLTKEQESLFEYTALAYCLPVDELVYGDFDCRGDRQAVFIDEWHDIASSLSIEYGIPWETVVAQGILESAAGTSRFAVERNNFFGIGAFDSNPDNAFSYATPEEGWRGYFENIAHVSTKVYCRAGVFRGETIVDPYAYLRAIKAAGYATDPHYVDLVSEIIKSVEARAEKKGWASSKQLAAEHPGMLTNAARFICW